MKIVVNYDLMDKIAEAEKGFSLKRSVKRTLGLASISTAIGAPDNFIKGEICPELLIEIGIFLTIHSMYTGAYIFVFNNMTKTSAQYKLRDLVANLRNCCIKTDEEAILDTYSYKTKYDVSFNSAIPIVEQKKYMMVPVRDEYFGDKEISIVQEHIIGSRDYVISLGEPEKPKVYSLGMNKMLGK